MVFANARSALATCRSGSLPVSCRGALPHAVSARMHAAHASRGTAGLGKLVRKKGFMSGLDPGSGDQRQSLGALEIADETLRLSRIRPDGGVGRVVLHIGGERPHQPHPPVLLPQELRPGAEGRLPAAAPWPHL